MNDHARAHFAANPDAKYWYYSRSLRVPNPKMYGKPGWQPDPWPETEPGQN